MFSKTSLVLAIALVCFSLGGMSAAQDDAHCYTLASLQGSYSVIGNYGDHLAIALARAQLDGKGNFASTFVVNEPDPASTTGGRKLVTGSQTGTYTINCNGTGVITRLVVSTVGTSTVVSDFVITRAVSKDRVLLATELSDAQRTPSFIVPGGVFLTRTYTRTPE
jgi:hypothetical protein